MRLRAALLTGLITAACFTGDADTGEVPEGGPDSPPWRAALARGVDFRALGQEPGWSLDIDQDGPTVYAGDYGTDTLAAPTPAAARDGGDAITWTFRADGRELRVRVTARECHDTMSGEAFTHSVAIVVDGTELTGCGRWLGDAAAPR